MTEHENEASNSNNKEQDQLAKYRLQLEQTADLVARIRHEINNPLTGVLGPAPLLIRADLSVKHPPPGPTKEDHAGRFGDVVSQLREIQRPGDGESSGA